MTDNYITFCFPSSYHQTSQVQINCKFKLITVTQELTWKSLQPWRVLQNQSCGIFLIVAILKISSPRNSVLTTHNFAKKNPLSWVFYGTFLKFWELCCIKQLWAAVFDVGLLDCWVWSILSLSKEHNLL